MPKVNEHYTFIMPCCLDLNLDALLDIEIAASFEKNFIYKKLHEKRIKFFFDRRSFFEKRRNFFRQIQIEAPNQQDPLFGVLNIS